MPTHRNANHSHQATKAETSAQSGRHTSRCFIVSTVLSSGVPYRNVVISTRSLEHFVLFCELSPHALRSRLTIHDEYKLWMLCALFYSRWMLGYDVFGYCFQYVFVCIFNLHVFFYGKHCDEYQAVNRRVLTLVTGDIDKLYCNQGNIINILLLQRRCTLITQKTNYTCITQNDTL